MWVKIKISSGTEVMVAGIKLGTRLHARKVCKCFTNYELTCSTGDMVATVKSDSFSFQGRVVAVLGSPTKPPVVLTDSGSSWRDC